MYTSTLIVRLNHVSDVVAIKTYIFEGGNMCCSTVYYHGKIRNLQGKSASSVLRSLGTVLLETSRSLDESNETCTDESQSGERRGIK